MTLELTYEIVDELKRGIRSAFPELKSSFRVEALARTMGYESYQEMLEAAACSDPLYELDQDGLDWAIEFLAIRGVDIDKSLWGREVERLISEITEYATAD